VPHILDLGCFNPQGKIPWYPLDRRQSGPHTQSGWGREEQYSQPPPGIKTQNPDHPAHSQSLYSLSYPNKLEECAKLLSLGHSDIKLICFLSQIFLSPYPGVCSSMTVYHTKHKLHIPNRSQTHHHLR
jgi:hypothetical protein